MINSAKIQFRDWYNSLQMAVKILAITVEADETFIELDNLYHLRKEQPFGDYEILRIEEDKIVIKDLPEDTFEVGQKVLLRLPFFASGSPMMVLQDLQNKKLKNKYPMLYFYESIREEVSAEESGSYLTASFRLFLLDECNPERWNNDQHFTNIIDRLRSFAGWLHQQMIDATISPFRSTEKIKFEFTNRLNWGAQKDKQVAWIFNDKLDAVEISFTASFKCC